tara:strand:- start:2433 stop:3389 length:957 start_codon:yes stop_codon:yes gene_type:complete
MKPGRTREDVRQEWKTTLSNFPLGAPKKNRRGGNPYLDQVKEIDKEIARLEKLVEKELKGSDNPGRDLKILNMKLKQDGTLNKNKLGIGRKFWQRKGIGEQINSYKERRKQLTKFLGDAYIVSGRQNTPKIKGFTPTYFKDVDSNARLINPYYIRGFDEAANTRDKKQYDTAKNDYMRSTDFSGSMSEEAIRSAIQSELPEGNMYRSDSKYYIGNRDQYGAVTKQVVPSETKTELAVNNTIRNNKSLSSSGGTVYSGGGWFGSGTDIRTSTGGSTTLTIHKGDDYKMAGRTIKAGDQVGVLTRSQRRNYNREVLGINT